MLGKSEEKQNLFHILFLVLNAIETMVLKALNVVLWIHREAPPIPYMIIQDVTTLCQRRFCSNPVTKLLTFRAMPCRQRN